MEVKSNYVIAKRNLSFGDAINAIHEGKKVSRAVWGGYWVLEDNEKFGEVIVAYLKDGGASVAQAYNADMLALDWEVLEEVKEEYGMHGVMDVHVYDYENNHLFTLDKIRTIKNRTSTYNNMNELIVIQSIYSEELLNNLCNNEYVSKPLTVKMVGWSRGVNDGLDHATTIVMDDVRLVDFCMNLGANDVGDTVFKFRYSLSEVSISKESGGELPL
jgi:CheY-like chemotaxis protein